MFQSDLTSLNSLKAIEININVHYFRTASNRRYLKTLIKSLK